MQWCARCCAAFSSAAARPRYFSAWSTFRRQLREQFTSPPDPPGVRNSTLMDPEAWERASKEDVRLALKFVLAQSLQEWLWLFRSLRRLVVGGEEDAASAPPPLPQPHAGAGAGAGAPLPVLTAEDARAAALALARGATRLTSDEQLRAKIKALGVEGMAVSREALDEFLLGYQVRRPAGGGRTRRVALRERRLTPPPPHKHTRHPRSSQEGKNEEIREFIKEQTKKQELLLEEARRASEGRAPPAAAVAPPPPPTREKLQ